MYILNVGTEDRSVVRELIIDKQVKFICCNSRSKLKKPKYKHF